MTRTYIENEALPHVPEEFLEENLRKNLSASNEDEIKFLQKYGQAFANLYYIKDRHEKMGYDEKLSFVEVDITGNGDIITDTQHFGMSYDPEQKLMQPALHVEMEDIEFNVGMMEFNKPNSAPEVKLQISFDENTAANIDADKLNSIFDFCEKHGISSSDMIIRRFDGSLDEEAVQDRLAKVIEEVQTQRAEQIAAVEKREEEQQNVRRKELAEELKNIIEKEGKSAEELSDDSVSLDMPDENRIMTAEKRGRGETSFKAEHLKQLSAHSDVQNEACDTASEMQQSAPQSITPAPKPKKKDATIKDAEEKFESFFEEGLTKRRNYSYFKTHTGLFGRGWTEYIIYESEDRKNRKKDGVQDKNGNVKYTYSFKLFMRQADDGRLQFAYRTPYHKPISEDIVGGIVGQLKDLGITHVNFPASIPDKEKGLWRKALAEKGLIPVGMGLDRVKAEGMLKAARDKLSTEEYSNFKYKLALQMDKHNKSKGKTVSRSEQEFIDGLILAHNYEAFANGYTAVIKGKITRIIHPPKEKENGAVDKIAALRNLRRMFNAFKEGVDAGSLLASEILTDKEKSLIQNAGLAGSPSMFTEGQIADLFDIMYEQSRIDAEKMLDVKFKEPGARRANEVIKQGVFNSAYNSCKSIVKELKALGVDEIDLPESTVELPYEKADNAQQQQKTAPQPSNSNSGAPKSSNGAVQQHMQTSRGERS